MTLRHKQALAFRCEACGAGSGVPCSTYAAQQEAYGFVQASAGIEPMACVEAWREMRGVPLFGLDRSPAAELRLMQQLAEWRTPSASRFYRFRLWLARLVVRALRVDASDM